MTTGPVIRRLAAAFATMAMLSFVPPASAQGAGERGYADSNFWRPMLDQCYRGANNYDAACAQHEVLKRGMANRFGEACYLGLKTSGNVSKLWLNKYLQKIRQCQDYALSYDETLRQCSGKGEPSCRVLVSGGGSTAAPPQPSGGGILGTFAGSKPPAPQQGGTPTIGGVLNTVEEAAGTLNTLKGLFQ